LVPSFSIDQSNTKYEIKGEFDGGVMEHAVQSAQIDLIKGLSANKGLKMNNSSQVQKIDRDFIFAINDQNLQKHRLNNTLIIAADVATNW